VTDQPMTHGARRAFAVLSVIVLMVGAASIFFTAGEAARLRAGVLASCAFAADLGGAPFPASAKVSKLGVSIVADSRAQWRHLGCPGHLAPPAPSFVKWARFYHLPDS
jgi:hypothetical protein